MDPIKAIAQQQLGEIHAIMSSDTDRCVAQLTNVSAEEPDQFWARTYVRTLMAWVEAYAFDMKATILRAHELSFASLSPADAGALSDCTYELDDRGVSYPRQRFTQIERTVRSVFRLYGKLFGIEYEISGTSDQWFTFRETVRARNRITHPRTAGDLTISKSELKAAVNTMTWFLNEHTRLLEATLEPMRSGELEKRVRRWHEVTNLSADALFGTKEGMTPSAE